MADYYSASPAPAPPAGGWLPYPWVTQFDPGYQTTYYANAETGESSWTPPDPNVVYSQPPPSPGPIHSASRGDMYNAASTPAATSSNNAGAGGSSGGEAASFYGSAGMAPMSQQASSQQSSYSPQDQQPQQQQYDENGQPIDGERGLGKVIIGGGLAYFAYKKYKEYQKGKLNQQQFKPPYQPPNHNNETPQLHPPHGGYNYVHYPQEHFGPPKRDNLDMMNTNGPPPPMPAWDQKPSPSPYGGPPPNAYNAPVASYQVSRPSFYLSLSFLHHN